MTANEIENELLARRILQNSHPTKTENENLQAIIYYLLDMLEEEHIGLKEIAIQNIKDTFGVELW